ncbi:LysM peptidoglycan-binding domain-containing protein [Elusimicrobiota bacterium]
MTLIIFVFVFGILGYISYISKISLDESNKRKEEVRELILEFADIKKRNSDNQAAIEMTFYAKNELEKLKTIWGKISVEEKTRIKKSLVDPSIFFERAQLFLDKATDGDGQMVFNAMVLINAAGSIVGRKHAPIMAKSARVIEPPSLTAAAIEPSSEIEDVDKTGSEEIIADDPGLRDSVAQFYMVRAGDTLWEISKRLYNTPWHWHTLWKTNEARIPNYRKMPAGMKLRLPLL